VIGLDTSVIIRFLVQDDAVQSPIATRFMSRLSREQPGFVSAVVLAEMTWVLSRAYRTSREDISNAVESLLRTAELIIENAEAAYRALAVYQVSDSAELADALIAQIARLAGASEIVSFDRKAATEAGMRLLH
jgi:predicted nucleic-acid-binding protein